MENDNWSHAHKQIVQIYSGTRPQFLCLECGLAYDPTASDENGDPKEWLIPAVLYKQEPETVRFARQYVLLPPEDCDPPHSLDLSPGSRDSMKVEWLSDKFKINGFDVTKPALIGYPKDGRIQLLSGTHRHEAARRVGMMLPVRIQLRSIVEAAFGTDKWVSLMSDIPVRDLEYAPVREDIAPKLEDRVDLDRDLVR